MQSLDLFRTKFFRNKPGEIVCGTDYRRMMSKFLIFCNPKSRYSFQIACLKQTHKLGQGLTMKKSLLKYIRNTYTTTFRSICPIGKNIWNILKKALIIQGLLNSSSPCIILQQYVVCGEQGKALFCIRDENANSKWGFSRPVGTDFSRLK